MPCDETHRECNRAPPAFVDDGLRQTDTTVRRHWNSSGVAERLALPLLFPLLFQNVNRPLLRVVFGALIPAACSDAQAC